MLNSVSRSLSDVGRSPSHDGALRRRPLYVPAITRTAGTTKTRNHEGARTIYFPVACGLWLVGFGFPAFLHPPPFPRSGAPPFGATGWGAPPPAAPAGNP